MKIVAFNGDADGLCALQQLSLREDLAGAALVTGPKRQIELVRGIHAGAGDEVTVLDVSLDVNRAAVERLLLAGARVRYFDHHYAGELPRHPRLEAHIDTSPGVCTSLIVDRYLGGAHRAWALVGAFGDNVVSGGEEDVSLKELGIALNYNGYGESLADLHFHPAELHGRMRRYADPLAFAREDPAFARLAEACRDDLSRAAGTPPLVESPHAALYLLPDAAWARRVCGVLASELARGAPRRAHAVALASRGGWQVSVRAPLARPAGAAALCRAFPSGGGREGAAGINHLPAGELERFAARFMAHFASPVSGQSAA
jgi:hypothetical protein